MRHGLARINVRDQGRVCNVGRFFYHGRRRPVFKNLRTINCVRQKVRSLGTGALFCRYIHGVAPTATLRRHIEVLEASTKARFEAAPRDDKIRRFKEFFDGAKSWSRVERIIARVEAGPEGPDTRFIVTNLNKRNARVLYEEVYCRRGQAENHIKSFKTHLAADRTKATANQLRLFLHAGAYWLMWGLRVSMPKRSMWRVAQFDTLRLRLIKIAARVVEMKTMIRVHLPTSCPVQDYPALRSGTHTAPRHLTGGARAPQTFTIVPSTANPPHPKLWLQAGADAARPNAGEIQRNHPKTPPTTAEPPKRCIKRASGETPPIDAHSETWIGFGRLGGARVALVCVLIEAAGLALIWLAHGPIVAATGAPRSQASATRWSTPDLAPRPFAAHRCWDAD